MKVFFKKKQQVKTFMIGGLGVLAPRFSVGETKVEEAVAGVDDVVAVVEAGKAD